MIEKIIEIIMWWKSQSFFIWSVEKQIDMWRAWSFTSWTFYFCVICFTVWCVCFLYIIYFMRKALSWKKKHEDRKQEEHKQTTENMKKHMHEAW